MLKQALLPAFTAVVLTVAAVPTANAGLALNGLALNGLALNGLALNGPGDDVALRAVRLTLPDGAQLTFR